VSRWAGDNNYSLTADDVDNDDDEAMAHIQLWCRNTPSPFNLQHFIVSNILDILFSYHSTCLCLSETTANVDQRLELHFTG